MLNDSRPCGEANSCGVEEDLEGQGLRLALHGVRPAAAAMAGPFAGAGAGGRLHKVTLRIPTSLMSDAIFEGLARAGDWTAIRSWAKRYST